MYFLGMYIVSVAMNVYERLCVCYVSKLRYLLRPLHISLLKTVDSRALAVK